MEKNGSRRVAGILIFAFLLRFGWAIAQPRTPGAIARLPDQQEYLSLGQTLLKHGSLFFVDPRFRQTIWAYRMPGYPAVIAACGGSVLMVRLTQCIIDTSTILAVFLIAKILQRGLDRENDGNIIAVIAAALIAVNPFYIYFSGLILSETIFTALLIWGIFFVVRKNFISGVTVLIAACYFRPAAVLMAPVIVVVAAMAPISKAAVRQAIVKGAVTVVLIVIAVLPWAWRNQQRLGSWIWTTTNGGITLYDGFNPTATGASDQRFLADRQKVKAMNEVERSRFLQEAARDWAMKHVRELPLLSLRKILRSWSPIPLSAEFGRPIYIIISAAYSVPFDLLCLVGLFSRRLDRISKILLTMPAVLITVIEIFSVGSLRYRIPAEATCAVLAAVGFVDLRERFLKSPPLAASRTKAF